MTSHLSLACTLCHRSEIGFAGTSRDSFPHFCAKFNIQPTDEYANIAFCQFHVQARMVPYQALAGAAYIKGEPHRDSLLSSAPIQRTHLKSPSLRPSRHIMQDTFDDLEIDSNSHPPVQSGATGSAYAPVINGSRPDRGVPIMQSLSNTTARGQVVGCGLPVVASIYNPTILPASYTIHPPHGIFGTIPSPMSPGPGIAPGPSNHYFSAPQVLRARVHGPNYGMTLSEVSGTNSGFTPLPPAVRAPVRA